MRKVEATVTVEDKKRTVTEVDGFKIISDSREEVGGRGEHPTPIILMLGSLLNCSLATLRGFCEKRDISTEGIKLEFSGDYENGIYETMTYDLVLPEDFPDRYRKSIKQIVSACTVKKCMQNLPEVEVNIKE